MAEIEEKDKKTEFVWLGDDLGTFQRKHLYRVADFPRGMVEEWVMTGAAAWREDVPAREVIIDLRPQPGTTTTVSKKAGIRS